MRGTLFVMYMTDDCDEDAVIAQLAELHAIPGVELVPMVPADMNDVVGQ